MLTAQNPEAGDFAGGIAFACALVDGGNGRGHRLHLRPRRLPRPPRRRFGPAGRPARGPPRRGPRSRARTLLRPTGPGHPGPASGPDLRLPARRGHGRDRAGRSWSSATATPGAVAPPWRRCSGFWTELTGRLQVETPSPAIDLMVNGWLPYQNLGCRIWARSAFYQSGGAFGFRDQLQDAAALVYLRPDLTRAQILLHAAHQFVEGDVLHWWHPRPWSAASAPASPTTCCGCPWSTATTSGSPATWASWPSRPPSCSAPAAGAGRGRGLPRRRSRAASPPTSTSTAAAPSTAP